MTKNYFKTLLVQCIQFLDFWFSGFDFSPALVQFDKINKLVPQSRLIMD